MLSCCIGPAICRISPKMAAAVITAIAAILRAPMIVTIIIGVVSVVVRR